MDVIHKNEWLNYTNNIAIVMSEEAKKKLSNARKGIARPFIGAKVKEKLRLYWDKAKGTEEYFAQCKRKSVTHKQRYQNGIGNLNKLSQSSLLKRRKSWEITRKNTIKICPHCNVSGTFPNIYVHHFNKCKFKK